jgi:hypothetical protein
MSRSGGVPQPERQQRVPARETNAHQLQQDDGGSCVGSMSVPHLNL